MSAQPSQIVHYRITSKLGEGGMGAVYRATDTKLNRDVAIKVLPEAFASDPDRLARFTREAQLLAQLNHPNIASIYGVEDRAIVLELVEGPTLAGPLPVEEALPLIEQLIDALEYAHDKGIIHRDLKPANLKLSADRRLKVLDFGLAKALSTEDTAASVDNTASPTLTVRATMAGAIMGTAAYMSPEQARGHAVDKRADIWSFGVVVYELLTGRQLFNGPTISDTLAAVLRQDLDFAILPARFRRVMAKCLTRDPRQRLHDISGAKLLLEEVPAAEPAPAQPPARGRWIGAVVASAVVALAALGVAWRATRPVERPMVRLSVDLGSDAVNVSQNLFALSPGADRIVFSVRGADGKQMLATRQLDQAKVELLRGTEGAFNPFFSPDGGWIGFFADHKLQKVSVHGGAPEVLCEVSPNPRGGTWTDDGSIIFAGSPVSGLSRVSAAGGAVETLTDASSKGQATHRWPQMLPNGKAILFTANVTSINFAQGEIDALDLKTRQWKTVQRGGYFGRYLPTGHLVYVHESTLLAIRFDPDKLETKGAPFPVLDDVAANSVAATGRFDFNAGSFGSGVLGYISGKTDSAIAKGVWMDKTGKSQPAAHVGTASPDGRMVAFMDGAIGSATVSVWDIARDVVIAVSPNRSDYLHPVWTPDGHHLVFSSRQGNSSIMWWARADGGGEALKLAESDRPLEPYSFSPDGRRLAYSEFAPDTAYDLWTMTLDLSEPEHPKAGKPEVFLRQPSSEATPAFSPDGRWMAYTASAMGSYQVEVRPFPGPGGHWQISSGGAGGVSPKWLRNGRQVLYSTLDGQIMVVDYEVRGDSFLPGKPRAWSEARISANMGRPEFDLMPDGQRVLTRVIPNDSPERNASVHVTLLFNFFDELKRKLP